MLAALLAILGLTACDPDPDEPDPTEDAGPSAGSDAGPPPGPPGEPPVQIIERNGALRSVRGFLQSPLAMGAPPEERADAFVDAYADALGLADPSTELGPATVIATDAAGSTVVFERLVDGVPVYGGEVRVHVDPDGVVRFASAALAADLAVASTTPTVATEVAVESARAALTLPAAISDAARLVVFNRGMLTDRETPSRLAWTFVLEGATGGTRAFVDASDGELLYSYLVDGAADVHVYDAGNEPDVHRLVGYGRAPVDAPLPDNASCALPRCGEDDDNDADRLPCCGAHELHFSGAAGAASLVDPEDPEARDAHRHLHAAADWFEREVGWSGYDGAGSDLHAFVHFGSPGLGNAFFFRGIDVVAFGDDQGSASVAAHELTHGVQTHVYSPLELSNLPGAVAEGLSDVFAAFVTGRWEIRDRDGSLVRDLTSDSGLTIADSAGALRILDEGVRPSWGNDNGHTHYNSGVVSRVAVQLALGGTYRAVEVHRVPLPDLYAIYMRAMRLYVHSTTTPSDLRDQLTAACVSLIDVPGGPAIQWTDCGSILNAFASAGIGPEDPDRDTWVETDNCPDEYNPYQEDLDDDGVGDACEEEPPGTLPPGPAIVQRLGVRERRTGITVPDALVLIRYEDALVASCRTDFGGGCQVDLPPGDYEAIARHPAWPDGSLRFSNPDTDPPRSSWLFQDVLVGTGEIDIVAVSGYVTLHDPDDPGPCALRELTGGGCDVPLPGVRVSLESASGAILVEDATRDVHAWFRLQGGLEAGVQYLAQARYPGYAVSRYATALSDSSTITWQPIMRPTNDECVTDPDAFVVLDGSIGAQGARVWMGPIGTGPDERPQSTAPDAAVICLGGAPARPAFRWNTAWMAGRMERVTQITVSVDDTLQWSLSSAAGLDPGVVYGQETGGTVGGIEPAPPLPSGVPIDVQVTGPTSAPEHSGRAVLQWRTP